VYHVSAVAYKFCFWFDLRGFLGYKDFGEEL